MRLDWTRIGKMTLYGMGATFGAFFVAALFQGMKRDNLKEQLNKTEENGVGYELSDKDVVIVTDRDLKLTYNLRNKVIYSHNDNIRADTTFLLKDMYPEKLADVFRVGCAIVRTAEVKYAKFGESDKRTATSSIDYIRQFGELHCRKPQ